jgi:hypothetical protein
MSATPATLNQAPDNVAAAEAVIAALDGCFLAGFARLGAAHRDSLASLGRVLAGTPLAPAMDDAVSALASGPPNEAHLMALAAARGALFGAAHDALFAQAIAATGGAVAPTAFAASATG